MERRPVPWLQDHTAMWPLATKGVGTVPAKIPAGFVLRRNKWASSEVCAQRVPKRSWKEQQWGTYATWFWDVLKVVVIGTVRCWYPDRQRSMDGPICMCSTCFQPSCLSKNAKGKGVSIQSVMSEPLERWGGGRGWVWIPASHLCKN